MMKNVFFYFMLKFLYALEIFTFLSEIFGFEENWLNKNAEVNSKLMTSQIGHHIIRIYIIRICCPMSHEVKAIRQ